MPLCADTTTGLNRSKLMPRLIDLSVPLENGVPADLGPGPSIEYIDHEQSVPSILPLFPGLKKQDLPDGKGWAVEQIKLSTHNGTHLDAPWHYHPTMNEGERSWTIDEVPLDWCFQPAVKLDFRHFADGYVATRGRRRGGAEAHRPRAEAARHRRRQHQRRRQIRPARTMCRPAAAWAPRRRNICSSAACG